MIQPELSLFEFKKRFGSERVCLNALEKMRWPDGFHCPKCKHNKACRIRTRRLLQCSKCRFQVSLTSRTIFHNTRTPLQKWFWAIYLVAFVLDSVSWQMALLPLNFDPSNIYRIWKIRMVGEAVNNATPLATMGGEPVKAVLLKRHFGMGYREGTASLIIAKTTNLLALIVFLAAGFCLMLVTEALPASYNIVAGAGLFAFTAVIILFFLVQRHRPDRAGGDGGPGGRGTLFQGRSLWLDAPQMAADGGYSGQFCHIRGCPPAAPGDAGDFPGGSDFGLAL